RYLPAHTVPHRREHAGVAVEPHRAADDRQADLRQRLSHVFEKPGVADQRSDHPARSGCDRARIVGVLAQRGFAELRPGVPGEAQLLMRSGAGGGGRVDRPGQRARARPLVAVAVLWLLALLPRTLDAAVDDYLGKPVESVNLLIEGRETTEAS